MGQGLWVVPSLPPRARDDRSEEHTSELQSQSNLVCRLLLEKKNKIIHILLFLALALIYHLFYSRAVFHRYGQLLHRKDLITDSLIADVPGQVQSDDHACVRT